MPARIPDSEVESVRRSAVAIQAGDPQRPVSVPDLARSTGMTVGHVQAIIQSIRRRARVDPSYPGWPFPPLRDAASVRARVKARDRASRHVAGCPSSAAGRAYRVEWRDLVRIIASASQNQAKVDAVHRLWVAHPDEAIHYRHVAVNRWTAYDAWAAAAAGGRLWTLDEVEDWMDLNLAAPVEGV